MDHHDSKYKNTMIILVWLQKNELTICAYETSWGRFSVYKLWQLLCIKLLTQQNQDAF